MYRETGASLEGVASVGSDRRDGNWFTISLFWSLFLLPSFGVPYQVERVALGGLAALLLLWFAMRGRLPRRYLGRSVPNLVLPLLLISVLYTVTHAWWVVIVGAETGIRDLLELVRYPFILLLVLFLIAVQRRVSREAFLRRCVIPSIWVSMSLFLVCLFDIPGLSDVIRYVYSGTKSSLNLDMLWIRWSIPFENPNFLGVYLVWCLATLLFFTKRLPPVSIICCLVLTFASGSRTAWVAALYIGIVWAVATVLHLTRRRLLVLTLCIAAVTSFFLVIDVGRFARAGLIGEAIARGSILYEGNVAFRVEQMLELGTKTLSVSPVFGFGPAKQALVAVIDSQYLLWLVRMGIIGLVLVMSFYTMIALVVPLRAAAREKRHYEAWGIVAFAGATAICLLTGAFLDNMRLLFLGAALLVWVISVPRTAARSVR